MGAFTADAAHALAGPEWLVERRLAAAERFAAGSLPTPSEEAWRYSRIEQFDLDRYQPAGSDKGREALPGNTKQWAGSVVCQNGRVIHALLDQALASKGVILADLTHPEAQQWLGTCSDASRDPFVDLHDAFLPGGAFIKVPDGVVVDRPFAVKHESRGSGLASFPHTLVVTGADAEVSVLERFDSFDDDEEHLAVPVTELVVGDASRVSYLGLQDQGQHVWQIALQRARVGQDATLRTSAVALGGDYARLRTEALLAGAGASSEMVAVYFANESQMLDFRTLQDHDAHHTTSDLLFKGAVEDEARSVYSGLVRLRESAQRARAAQTNRNLVLSEGAAAWSIPNLEIEANDVKCSHASAVGPIDLDQLYYLESRGVPPDVAERLIVFGFFEDVISRLPLTDLAGPLRSAVARKFEARRCCHAEEVPARLA
ncbi:MAG: Fe-S cluster assembly protein SufD [Actinomycetota bacterium]|nr:Fe-S cluster assembly protein SufD [Actinomycetota bacterium]